MNYKQQLEQMVEMVVILTKLRIHQARDYDSPCFEGKYYGPIPSRCTGIITLDAQP